MFRKTMLGVAVGLLCACFSEAGPVTVPWTSGTTIELGQWYEGNGVLDAAKARAAELGVPLLVLWTSSSCGHCAAFERSMDGAEFIAYLANRGLVMVYGQDNTGGPIKKWVGTGEYPLWRVTWTQGGVDHKGKYPKSYAGFRAELEAQISGYTPGVVNASKDAYDPASDTAATAPTLIWKTTAATETLRLSSGTDYTDLADWYKLVVVGGNSYKVWFSNVTGQSADTVQAAVYGDAAGTVVIQSPVALAAADFEFFTPADGVVYVKVWRTTSHDSNIQYAMSYLREAVGKLSAAEYQGWVGDLGGDGVQGTVALSVNASGKISGKAVFPTKGPLYAGTYTLASANYDMLSNGTAWVSGTFSKGGDTVPVVFGISLDSGRVVGSLGPVADVLPVELYRDDWAKAEWAAVAAKFDGYYTVAFQNCCGAFWPDDAPLGSGFATITLDNKGRFKVAGKLGDGTALSLGGVLFLRPDTTLTNPVLCALLYSAPTAYKGGLFGGVICFGDENTNGVKDVSMGYGERMAWNSYDPFSVPVYDEDEPGFRSWPSAVGGWYNRLEDLKEYYAGKTIYVGDLSEPAALTYTYTLIDDDGTTRSEEPATPSSWQATSTNLPISVKANGSGFTTPTADLKYLGLDDEGNPLYNYDSGVNPNGLNMAFNRTTGVMSGSFKIYYDYVLKEDARTDPPKLTWKHVQKVANYAAILMLEQAEAASDLVSSGYYLLSDSATYETATGAERKYSLKRSYEFVTKVNE